MKIMSILRMCIICCTTILFSVTSLSCSILNPPPAQPPARQQKPVDHKAQQTYYDLGVQLYSKEQFEEARQAFRKVVEISPATKLGIRAKENLIKIEQILKTLEEKESK